MFVLLPAISPSEGTRPMFGIGYQEMFIVLVVALVIFGPKRLPDAGRSLGRGLREFKGAIGGGDEPREREDPPAA